MPYGDPDPQDPNVLVGVALPGGLEEVREMAWVFADEFARLGYGEERIAALFADPDFAGPHLAWRTLGEVEVRAIARESATAFARFRVTVHDAPEEPEEPSPGPRRLPLHRDH